MLPHLTYHMIIYVLENDKLKQPTEFHSKTVCIYNQVRDGICPYESEDKNIDVTNVLEYLLNLQTCTIVSNDFNVHVVANWKVKTTLPP